MRAKFILVDFENVQPKDLALLQDGPFQVKLFLGPNQSKIPVSLASALQTLGRNVEYVALESAGKNALDFHIAYYIGLLSAADPKACFNIISKDSGFDPLIRHLRARKICAHRSNCLSNFHSTINAPPPSAPAAQVDLVVAHLLKASKPRTQKTLLGTLHTLFKKELSSQQLTEIIASLCRRGIVKVDGDNVSYQLPSKPSRPRPPKRVGSGGSLEP